MKKIISIFFALTGLFFVCLATSILIKNYFEIEGDYLSAFSTLVAALVAFYLFTDWKVEHKIKLMEQYQNNLKVKSSDLLMTSYKASEQLSLIVGSKVEDGYQHFHNAIRETQDFQVIVKNIHQEISGYILLLSHLEKTNLVQKNIEVCEFFSEKLREINREVLDKLYENKNGIDINSITTEDYYYWNKVLREFDYLVTYEIQEFYISYLNSLK
ncbi:hypothetical protein APC62_07535 [Acinetobacter pittii]|uniref:hypothetical protein n=1 Tax=Acinetobacter pittii TaxID=48296 RepID=UPI0007090229|nr:hypothetical protein [Acinetobacter pittii]KRI62336.1 hypothetical protein APC62_07535 [Acinetobacter pittii]